LKKNKTSIKEPRTKIKKVRIIIEIYKKKRTNVYFFRLERENKGKKKTTTDDKLPIKHHHAPHQEE
jgi:hypothetical protein